MLFGGLDARSGGSGQRSAEDSGVELQVLSFPEEEFNEDARDLAEKFLDAKFGVEGSVGLLVNQHLPPRPFVIATIWAASMTLIFVTTLGSTAIILAWRDSSSALLAYAADQYLDIVRRCTLLLRNYYSTSFFFLISQFTSVLILWRFCENSKNLNKISERDRKATQVIAMFFVVLGLYITVHCVYSISLGVRPDASDGMLALAAISAFVFGLLSLCKYYLANRIQSGSLRYGALLHGIQLP